MRRLASLHRESKYKLNDKRDDRTDWTVIPLHEYRLQRLIRGSHSLTFALIFAYSLAALQDFLVEEKNLPNVTYWIGKGALTGTPLHEDLDSDSSIWEETKVDHYAFSIGKKHFRTSKTPFQRLEKFLLDNPCKRDNLTTKGDSNEGDSYLKGILKNSKKKTKVPQSTGSSFQDFSKQSRNKFIDYCRTEVHTLLDVISAISALSEGLSERLYALFSLSIETFADYASEEYELKIFPTYRSVAASISDELYCLLVSTIKGPHHTFENPQFEYVYNMSRKFGLGKREFVKWVMFPELLTTVSS